MLCSTLRLVWAKDTNVYITNDLEGREDLNIHCKSGDDDLGQHVLHINQDFKMRFGANYLWGTLFFLFVSMGNGPLLHFDV